MPRVSTALLLLAMTGADAAPLPEPSRIRRDSAHYATTAATMPALRTLRDQAYGKDPRQRFDAYLPATGNGIPLIVMVHGGAWRTGDKDHAAVVANKRAHWLPRGIGLVSVNYRMLPDTPPAGQLQDVAAALAHVQATAAAWGADPDKVVLMGHSAGAHLAALLGADPAPVMRAGGRPWRGTVALDSAALDVVAVMGGRHARLYDRAFGDNEANWRALSPRQRLTTSATPMLLVCSSKRRDDSCDQASAMAASARALGRRAEVLPQFLSHRDINADLGLPGAYTDAVDAFLASLDAAFAQRLAH